MSLLPKSRICSSAIANPAGPRAGPGTVSEDRGASRAGLVRQPSESAFPTFGRLPPLGQPGTARALPPGLAFAHYTRPGTGGEGDRVRVGGSDERPAS